MGARYYSPPPFAFHAEEHFLVIITIALFSVPTARSDANPIRLPTLDRKDNDDDDACREWSERSPDSSCPVKCFRPNPVCGVNGLTYWCGCDDARCAGTKVAKKGFFGQHLEDQKKLKAKDTVMQMVATDWLRSDKREDDLTVLTPSTPQRPSLVELQRRPSGCLRGYTISLPLCVLLIRRYTSMKSRKNSSTRARDLKENRASAGDWQK
ncbi:hypothetical protein SADUNF_Sadunf16G0036900 [Salix dunnii]|uniref:Uncharacterized protein n=1 Tax=Salix dunnii TaxID=1413687 RepID=A0A835J888_9ROSI|nr:hypothetical protein SADUNF_Sadunf16G0036900 [Salix dunnii]